MPIPTPTIPPPIPMPIIGGDPLSDRQWALHHLDVSAGWACVSPDSPGVIVAVVDSGIDAGHQDLLGRLLLAQTVITGTADDDDHGTMVAGAIASATGNGFGIAGATGTANVQILPVRFCSQGRWPEPNLGAAAIDLAAGYQPTDERKRVIVLAWDVGYRTPALDAAIDHARDADALVVVAAGNHAWDNDRYGNWPANYGSMSHVITVMATDRDDERGALATSPDDERASFSNYGRTTVHIAAPGRHPRYETLSTVPYLGPPPPAKQGPIGVGYRAFGGTSMATAYVAALAALVRIKHPGMTAPQVKAHLIATARPVAALTNLCVAGGIADFPAALCP
jgi:subtilisin family serine protease